MTTDTPRTDAASFASQDPLELLKTSQQLERELKRANDEIEFYEKIGQEKVDELRASKAEVERLKELVNESIVEKSNLSIALVNCQANLRRAIDVAKMLPVIPIPAISSRDITDTLYAELNQLKTTLNPTTEDSSEPQL